MAEPLRDRIWKDLLGKIRDGDLAVGARIPTEKEMEFIYGVSRTPIREALSRLADEGHIVRRPGRGTFVSDSPPGAPRASISGFTHCYRDKYKDISGRTLLVRTQKPEESIARLLGMSSDQESVYIEGVRMVDGVSVAYMRTTFSPRFTAGPFEETPGFPMMTAFLLDHFSVRCTFATEDVDAILPEPRDMEILGVASDHPLLQVQRLVHDEAGGPVLSSRYVVNSAIWKYRASLVI